MPTAADRERRHIATYGMAPDVRLLWTSRDGLLHNRLWGCTGEGQEEHAEREGRPSLPARRSDDLRHTGLALRAVATTSRFVDRP
jgi:hypothetical protein